MSFEFIPQSNISNLEPYPDIKPKRIDKYYQNKLCIDPCVNSCGFITRADIVLFGLVFVITYLIIILINPISLRKAGTDEIDRITVVILSLFVSFIALALYSLKKH